MSDPAVAAALRAAGEAARQAMCKPGCCMEGTGCELPPCHCSRVGAAAALTAFHASLAEAGSVRLPGDHGLLLPYISRALAAAVTRAAEED